MSENKNQALFQMPTTRPAPVCRFCLEPDPPLFQPCNCKGSVAWLHEACLRQWVQVAPPDQRARCQLCLARFRNCIIPTFEVMPDADHILSRFLAFPYPALLVCYYLAMVRASMMPSGLTLAGEVVQAINLDAQILYQAAYFAAFILQMRVANPLLYIQTLLTQGVLRTVLLHGVLEIALLVHWWPTVLLLDILMPYYWMRHFTALLEVNHQLLMQ